MQFTTKAGKDFEKPDSGMYHGVLADVVDLGDVPTTFQGITKVQPMVRFVWILNKNGKDGKPLSVTQRFGVNLHEKSNLYKSVKQILSAAPPLTLDAESLVGSVRKLFIQREITENGNQKTDFANVLGISPADPGVTVPVPADFVRDRNKPVAEQAKNKKKTQQSAPAQTTGQPTGNQAPTQQTQQFTQAQLLEMLAKTQGGQGADVKF